VAELTELRYPLGQGGRDGVRSATGRAVSDVTLDAVIAGGVEAGDVAISSETLVLQAEFAQRGGNPQLAENLRRAAELVAFDDDELLHFYEMLRPGRSSAEQLAALAESLAQRGAQRSAALVREARAVYLRRGLIT
jgi:propanediol dehydratase small subunit